MNLLRRIFRRKMDMEPSQLSGASAEEEADRRELPAHGCSVCGATGPWSRRTSQGQPLCEACFEKEALEAVWHFTKVHNISFGDKRAKRDKPWRFVCPSCKNSYIIGVNAAIGSMRGLLFRNSNVARGLPALPVLIGFLNKEHSDLPKTLSELNWECHKHAIEELYPQILAREVTGWVCESCSNWANPSPFPPLPPGLLLRSDRQ